MATNARCENCINSLFDDRWGDYKCKKKQRRCTETEVAMGCSQFQKIGTRPDDPPSELVIRSGATFTPSVSKTGVLSWTNDKNLPNPAPVNITGPQGKQGPKGDFPVIGVDYFTDADKQVIVDEVLRYVGIAQPTARLGEVTLLASAWTGEGNLYSQVVSVDGVTKNSQVDLTPDVEQLTVFYDKDLTFVTENDGGIVTVYAIGQKPMNDYTIQITITEVLT